MIYLYQSKTYTKVSDRMEQRNYNILFTKGFKDQIDCLTLWTNSSQKTWYGRKYYDWDILWDWFVQVPKRTKQIKDLLKLHGLYSHILILSEYLHLFDKKKKKLLFSCPQKLKSLYSFGDFHIQNKSSGY